MIQKIVTMLKNIGTDRHDSAARAGKEDADLLSRQRHAALFNAMS